MRPSDTEQAESQSVSGPVLQVIFKTSWSTHFRLSINNGAGKWMGELSLTMVNQMNLASHFGSVVNSTLKIKK